MNLILERTDAVPFFTEMQSVFHALGLRARDFDWFISDIETNYYGDDFNDDDQWIDGDSLENFITLHSVQFIWAVFSAFPKGVRFVVDEAPIVEDNAAYWSGMEVCPQLEKALFEIAAWDSSATLLIGLPDTATARFMSCYPEAKPLASVSNSKRAL